MLRIENVRDVDQNGKAVLDFQCSTIADLPTINQLVPGSSRLVPGSSRYVTAAGSIAQVIQTGELYTLDADGKWYVDGEEAS